MKIYSIGDFAKLTNVTVKTLRHYEKLGLVLPSYNPDNGYRRYNQKHINQIESVMALKLLGFSLTEIGNHFRDNSQKSTLSLIAQKQALNQKLSEIKQIVELIDKVEKRKQNSELKDWIDLIREMKMQTRDIDWYLNQTEEDMVKLGTYVPDISEKAQLKLKWKNLTKRAYEQMALFDEVAFDKLAVEWIAMVGRFIDNKQTMVAIFKNYTLMHDWPEDRKFFSVELGEFIGPKLIAKLG